MGTPTTAKTRRPRSRWLSTCIVGIICLIVIVLSEVFVFNLPYWQTRDNTPQRVTDYSLSDGMTRSRSGDITIDGKKKPYIEVGSTQLITYVYLDIDDTTLANNNVHYTLATQQTRVMGWFSGEQERLLSPVSEASKYIHVDDNAKAVRIQFKWSKKFRISLAKIVVNPRIPFRVDTTRLLIMAVLALFIIFFRPASPLYRSSLADKLTPRSAQFYGLVLLTLMQVTVLVAMWNWTGGAEPSSGWGRTIFGFRMDYDQYARLGSAIIQGHTYLDLPVPDSLASMPNPYDPNLRSLATNGGEDPIYWDHAFYNGRYYSYFGVVPAVLLYVPYQLITGIWMNTRVAVLAMGIVATCLMTVLVVQIARTYFKERASFGFVLLGIIMLNLGSSIHYQVFTGNFYAVPGVASLVVTFAGLSLWLAAKRHHCSKTLIALGSFCMALNLGCRPQFILAAVLALPIFWDELVHERLFLSLSWKGAANTVAAFLPFVLVFAPLLAYNAARFTGPFDFGASYNLTGFSMPDMQFAWRNIFPLLYYFLFQPSAISGAFPFVGTTATPLPVWYPAEPSPGGLFAICPFLFVVVLTTVLFKERHSHSRQKALSLSFMGVAAAILIVDAVTCGLAWRYYLDFGWLFSLTAVFCAMRIGESYHDHDDRSLTNSMTTLLFLGVGLSLLFIGFSWFMTGRFTPIIHVNPEFYYDVAMWFLPFS